MPDTINCRSILTAVILFFSVAIQAQLTLPKIFSDNMILQREKPVNIWGRALPGKEVTVSFSSQQKKATAGADGNWSLQLDPMPANADPQDLMISSDSAIVFHNILVGDIWLCSGQSNMEYPMDRKWKKYTAPKKGKDLAEEELASANKSTGIRYIYVERTLNKFPQLPTKGWVTGNDTTLRFVTAAGYFFAKDIYREINIPVGIIHSNWGGTRIEQWTPAWAYKGSVTFKDSVLKEDFSIDGMKPGQMFKGLIQPLLPFSIKGILWYQGESNCMIEDQATYPEKFDLFVKSWRTLFKDEQLPVYTVQISPYLYTARKDAKKHSNTLLPLFWEAQEKCLQTPNTEMIVTTDLVDDLSNIHPSYKWEVGRRLALTALAKTYGKDVEYSGPLYESMEVKKDKVWLSFTHTGKKLRSSDGNKLSWFSIAGADGKFVKAEVKIKKKKLIVYSNEVNEPRYVRFAWDETAMPNLVNKAGLPARPFRTDNF